MSRPMTELLQVLLSGSPSLILVYIGCPKGRERLEPPLSPDNTERHRRFGNTSEPLPSDLGQRTFFGGGPRPSYRKTWVSSVNRTRVQGEPAVGVRIA